MNTHLPHALSLVVLTLAVFRLARLIGWDDITIRARGYVTGIPDDDHSQWVEILEGHVQQGIDPWRQGLSGVETPSGRLDRPPFSRFRWDVAKMIRCPWCVGWWLSVAAWLLVATWPRATLFGAIPLAISAAVGLIAKRLDP